jgi:hypothetical protein
VVFKLFQLGVESLFVLDPLNSLLVNFAKLLLEVSDLILQILLNLLVSGLFSLQRPYFSFLTLIFNFTLSLLSSK